MDDSLKSMVLHGCHLATILEQNLPILVNQPDILVKSCEEIVSVFSNVKERVLYVGQMGVQELHGFEIGGGTREHAMPTLDAQAAIPEGGSAYVKHLDDVLESSEMKGMFLHDEWQRRQLGLELMIGEMHGAVGGDIKGGSSGGIGGETTLDFSAATSSQRQGSRKNEPDRVVKRIAAPPGNTDTPPEDGFTWKKYGQKEILGRVYQRSYYICTHHKLHNCPAKKQVQRLDHEPFIFEVTYRNNHTCRVSSAATPPVLIPPSTVAPPPPLSTTSLVSMNIFHHLGRHVPATSSGMEAGSRGGSGPFNDFQAVADMADAMFNSGSSSSNSMDLIFSSMDEYHKWDSTEEKKD